MNINALARAILDRKLHPEFPIVVEDSEGKKSDVIAFMVDAEKCCLFIKTGEPEERKHLKNARP